MELTVHGMRYAGGRVESELVLRTLEESDIPAYAEMVNACFAPMRRALGIEPVDCCAPAEVLLRNRERIFLMEEADGLAGAVTLKGSEIDDLVVAPERRRRGLGSQLLRWAVHRLQQEGVESITCTRRTGTAAQ